MCLRLLINVVVGGIVIITAFVAAALFIFFLDFLKFFVFLMFGLAFVIMRLVFVLLNPRFKFGLFLHGLLVQDVILLSVIRCLLVFLDKPLVVLLLVLDIFLVLLVRFLFLLHLRLLGLFSLWFLSLGLLNLGRLFLWLLLLVSVHLLSQSVQAKLLGLLRCLICNGHD